jgi:hypothetical protein
MVGLLVAVGIATLLAIVLSVGYAVALRELRQINANFERELVAVSRRHDKPSREAPRDIGWKSTRCLQALIFSWSAWLSSGCRSLPTVLRS